MTTYPYQHRHVILAFCALISSGCAGDDGASARPGVESEGDADGPGAGNDNQGTELPPGQGGADLPGGENDGQGTEPPPQPGDSGFLHPGTLNIQAELDFVKQRIVEGAEPWTSKFEQVKLIAQELPSGVTTVDSTDDAAANMMKADAQGAYAAALSWHYTADPSYAEKAIFLLNSWSVFTGFTAGTDQDKLLAAWTGALFGPASDLMLGYEGWPAENVAALRTMFQTAYYPQLEVASSWNGNVDLTQIEALLAIAVFNEDRSMFDLALGRLDARMPQYFYLESEPTGNAGTWHQPTAWTSGLTQETCRDNGHHAQYALSAALAAAEIAWHQGEDVYAVHQERFVAALELLSLQLTSGSMQGTCSDDATTSSRFDTFEIGYNHFAHRVGLELPQTELGLAQEVRPWGRSDWNIFYETLTHADVSE